MRRARLPKQAGAQVHVFEVLRKQRSAGSSADAPAVEGVRRTKEGRAQKEGSGERREQNGNKAACGIRCLRNKAVCADGYGADVQRHLTGSTGICRHHRSVSVASSGRVTDTVGQSGSSSGRITDTAGPSDPSAGRAKDAVGQTGSSSGRACRK